MKMEHYSSRLFNRWDTFGGPCGSPKFGFSNFAPRIEYPNPENQKGKRQRRWPQWLRINALADWAISSLSSNFHREKIEDEATKRLIFFALMQIPLKQLRIKQMQGMYH